MHDQRTKPAVPAIDEANGDTDELSKRNDIIGLRALMFQEIRNLKGKATKEQIEIAKVKSDLANTIINSLKVEVAYLQTAKRSGSGFIPVLAVTGPAVNGEAGDTGDTK